MSDVSHTERVSVENGGLRVHCPRCGNPNVLARKIERATFAQCSWEDCGAWIAYDVSIVAKAFDEREAAKYAFETEIYDE